jgi:transcriptional regulator with XRE-family HTH domain
MARNFKELRAKMAPESRARVEQRVQEALRAMPLEGLREARELTQTQLAQILRVSQGAVSKVERRADMYISTLRSYIRAIGGDLQIRAVFPEGDVLIDQFEGLNLSTADPAPTATTMPVVIESAGALAENFEYNSQHGGN